ncbi:MAG TPA: FtsQ-type POTRA domain-containing protein [Terriglobia bacterium]|nr:FtsQ-type POTRA domain-containing protein [Terriglobia bacterium]
MKNKVWKWFLLSAAGAVLIVVGVSGYAVSHYLYTSPRFDVRRVLVFGLNRVKEDDVTSRAALPDSVNAFAVDLAEVRERVEGLRWVRYATVQRVLPDTISIKVVERTPVGLATIRGDVFQFDEEAHLLDRDRDSGAAFPILNGLKKDDIEGNHKKVALYLRIMEELNGRNELSEVLINDTFEVSVISVNEPILVTLGKEKFRERWGHFLMLRSKIQTEFPNTVQVDFRFRNQAILRSQVDGADQEQKVLWDVERKSL